MRFLRCILLLLAISQCLGCSSLNLKAASPSLLFIDGNSGNVVGFDLKTHLAENINAVCPSPAAIAAFSGTLALYSRDRGILYIYDYPGYKIRFALKIAMNAECLSFNDEGLLLCSGEDNHEFVITDISSGSMKRLPAEHGLDNAVWCGDSIVGFDNEGMFRCYLADGTEKGALAADEDLVDIISAGASGFMALEENTVACFGLNPLRRLNDRRIALDALSVLPLGTDGAICALNGEPALGIIDFANNSAITRIKTEKPCLCLTRSSNGQFVYAADGAGNVYCVTLHDSKIAERMMLGAKIKPVSAVYMEPARKKRK